jgi:hypothetical protein
MNRLVSISDLVRASKLIAATIMLIASILPGHTANIMWVTDANDPAVGFFDPNSTYTDAGFVKLLQSAGHNVRLFNSPNDPAILLTPEQIAALNTNHLVIISRTVVSGPFQPGQGNQWNTDITAPLIDMSPFHARTGSSRLGWLAGAEGPDSTPSSLSAMLSGDPATDAVIDYIFGGVPMNGTNTALPYDELLDRNTSQIPGAPVAGGIAYATSTYMRDDGNVTPAFGYVIVGFPAGTAVRGGADILGGYRMFFSAGTRESASAPNTVNLYAGRETLTPIGEDIFLRAIEVAIRNGAAPPSNPNAPIVFTRQPTNATVLEGFPVTFTVAVTGAAPRTLQWQRDSGGGTFVNIPDAATAFSSSSITLSNVTRADNGARFRVEASNAQGTVVGSVATLTVTPDMSAPVVLSAASADGATIGICFNELLDERVDANTAEEEFNYSINGASPAMAVRRPDGRTVLLTLTEPLTTNTFNLTVIFVEDRLGNAITSATLVGTNHGLTSAALGPLMPAGSSFSCASNSFEIGGSAGHNVQSVEDTMQFLYRTVDGDFDARVRVNSLVGEGRIEAVAKAFLSARATAEAASAAVNVIVTPPAPADATIVSAVRPSPGAATNTTTASFKPNGLPNAWMRITRAGDVFTTYRSTNGTSWAELETATVALGPMALVGIGANSHRNNWLMTATFSDFQIQQGRAQPRLRNPSYTGPTTFSASVDTQAGARYEIQYKNNLNDATWTTLMSIPGDGTVQPFNDTSATGPMRFYRVVVF